MNTKTPADFYFDPVSPFAFLMWKRLREDDFGLEIRPVPVLLGALLNHWGLIGPAEVPPKRAQTYRMCQWLADRNGIALRFPDTHPFRSVEALRLLIALDARANAVDAVFEAVFTQGRDLTDAAELERLGGELGLSNVQDRIASADVKDGLRVNTETAIARGVFGVPSLAIGEELFWGFDTLDMVRDYLADPKMFQTAEMQRLGTLDYGVPRKAGS
ncbi:MULTISPECIES: 2-hydroxychromene-2-carboxylate isomerase [unclassified Sphingobium]|uniref:2-hydroxychromene-2-carboxylate isomerase n=1 Tax=unclassified Sphingobium TaxID=2611147 RepID=UPI000D17796D|nr:MULTISPECIES: 2-hydroxychromene-2-carboxylate isomerase [unclassified Sphingobium]MBG6116555.1 2-hydroxychromene-2-carboxylate isomerase [Sphingobium sp. JAI105]PSO10852.1 2-hydroxychromene-2-carboxylate isomerase [Sphingobium sp. AEW4]TWD04435.1 2-hydroxychromene-2-carboxylate isomerase [Sphingobium sp. AEW010]TWD21896.1 2-hydroxychromene-2-carboxylate isomerase [Sphingobium sp. AEW013]TWD24588.1 2-hydroxychromene-2-carboxylate isomerase [Sphingobium sp. AEW001]